MFEKLELLEKRYIEIEELLASPEVFNDPQAAARLFKEQKEIGEVVGVYREYKKTLKDMREAEELMGGGNEPEIKELAEAEFVQAKAASERLAEQLKVLLLPKDPDGEKNVIVEIRAGAGGEEAALFAGVLYRMYCIYADSRRWKTEAVNSNETELGDYKEI